MSAVPTGSAGRLTRFAITAVHGFSCGLPLLATKDTLKAWLADANVKTETIGLFSSVGTPYALKFLWSPFLDRYVPPLFGRRRGWMIIAQATTGLLLAGIGLVSPAATPLMFGLVALGIAFASASQDIVVDAYRRETLHNDELALGSSLYVVGYRAAMLVAGGGALALADHVPWPTVYAGLGALMAIGALASWWGDEPVLDLPPPKSMREAVIEPLREFFQRDGALTILAFVLMYKLGDQLASSMSMPFYKKGLGFANEEIAVIVKTFGIAALLVGGIVGGAVTLRIGTNRALWVLGLFQACSMMSLTALALVGKNHALLTFAIGAEMVTMGAATSAFLAFMAAQTDKRFTATQYALMSALTAVSGSFLSMPTGYLAEALGWPMYFVFCVACAVPGMALLTVVAPWPTASRESTP